MQLGMIGLGRMGANMTVRLLRAGHDCVVQGSQPAVVDRLAAQGARATRSVEEQVRALTAPRVLWLMVPAGAVGSTLERLMPLLEPGDVVVDGGNSFYRDDIRRAGELAAVGLHHVDVGTSGGVHGLDRGYCLMIGGEPEVVQRLRPLFEALAPGRDAAPPTPGRRASHGGADHGWLHCGPHGAGHFVKMVHNGIEYGVMAAYAEGLNLLRHADAGLGDGVVDAETAPLGDPAMYRYRMDLPEIAELWRRGSVIGSWLLDLTAEALAADPMLERFEGRVSDSGEGRWTVQAAVDLGVPAPVLSAALFARFDSRGHADYAHRVLSAMRHAFGGHVEKAPGG
jgi:6-phosphogluconate dehydrogenase